MAEGFKIAEGFLEVDADTRPARRAVKGFLKESEIQLDVTEKMFKQSGTDAGEGFGKNVTEGVRKELGGGFFRDVRGRLRDARGRFAREGDLAGRSFGRRFAAGFGRLFGGDGLFGSLRDGLSDGIGRLRELGRTLGEIGQVFSTVGGAILSGLKIAAIAAAIPVIIALGGALLDLAGIIALMPAGISFLAATLATLMIAFKGVGGAIAAGLSGDMEKFNEALKGLSKSAQTVVREFVKLQPLLHKIKMDVQEAVFKPLVGVTTRLGKVLLPTLDRGLTAVGGSIGRFIASLLDTFSSTDPLKSLTTIFQTTARIIDGLTGPVTRLFGVMFGAAERGMPFLERAFSALGRGIDKLTDFLSRSFKTGDFERWLETAFQTMKDLWNLTKSLGRLLGAIFGDAGDEGRSFIQTLTAITDKLTAFFKSKEGKEGLKNILAGLKTIGAALMGLASLITFVIRVNNGLVKTFHAIGTFFGKTLPHWFDVAKDAVVGFFVAVGHWFADLGRSIWGFIRGAGVAIGHFFADLGRTVWGFITGAAAAVADWLQKLPSRVLSFLTALPGRVATAFSALIHGMAFEFGFILGVVGRFLYELPGRVITMFTNLWNAVKTLFSQGREGAVNETKSLFYTVTAFFLSMKDKAITFAFDLWHGIVAAFDALVAYLFSLPERAGRALSSLWSIVTNAFWSAVHGGIDAFHWLVDAAPRFINDLKVRVLNALSSAGSWLYQAGRDMISGLINGVTSLLGWAVDKAKGIAHSIADGFKKGLGISSPSKVMRDEVGRWILPGVMEGMENTHGKMRQFVGNVSGEVPAMAGAGANGAPASINATLGGPITLLVDLGDGIRTAVRATIVGSPRLVAAASAEGTRQRSQINTGRTA